MWCYWHDLGFPSRNDPIFEGDNDVKGLMKQTNEFYGLFLMGFDYIVWRDISGSIQEGFVADMNTIWK